MKGLSFCSTKVTPKQVALPFKFVYVAHVDCYCADHSTADTQLRLVSAMVEAALCFTLLSTNPAAQVVIHQNKMISFETEYVDPIERA